MASITEPPYDAIWFVVYSESGTRLLSRCNLPEPPSFATAGPLAVIETAAHKAGALVSRYSFLCVMNLCITFVLVEYLQNFFDILHLHVSYFIATFFQKQKTNTLCDSFALFLTPCLPLCVCAFHANAFIFELATFPPVSTQMAYVSE
jgi:hypothetical protein